VLERKAPPTFEIAVEMMERQRWVVHESVANTVDTLLRGRQPLLQTRTIGQDGQVIITQEAPTQPRGIGQELREESSLSPLSRVSPVLPVNGWRATGKMLPLPTAGQQEATGGEQEFERLLNESLQQPDRLDEMALKAGPNGEDLPLHIYPYGVSRHQLEHVIQVLNLPVVLTKDIDSADAILALRSHVKNHSKLRHVAKARHVPIHMIKASTIPQVTRTLRRLLDMEEPGSPDDQELSLYIQGGSEDELDALEEARLAVEQIVIPKGQPVELLPRSAKVRKMQHELVEHYRLKSDSFGDEPNRRLRIYPA
jgi:hypothetical protein